MINLDERTKSANDINIFQQKCEQFSPDVGMYTCVKDGEEETELLEVQITSKQPAHIWD